MHDPVLHIPLSNKTLRRPRILIPRALTNVAPVLLVEHVEVSPVRASVRIRPNRQRGSSERAANHGGVDAVGTAVDDCAPGAGAGGTSCQRWDGFDVGVGLLVDEEAVSVCQGGVCKDGYRGVGDACGVYVRWF